MNLYSQLGEPSTKQHSYLFGADVEMKNDLVVAIGQFAVHGKDAELVAIDARRNRSELKTGHRRVRRPPLSVTCESATCVSPAPES